MRRQMEDHIIVDEELNGPERLVEEVVPSMVDGMRTETSTFETPTRLHRNLLKDATTPAFFLGIIHSRPKVRGRRVRDLVCDGRPAAIRRPDASLLT